MADVILQHFLLPSHADRPLCLYAREQVSRVLSPGVLSFDTYFNSFSLKKWRRYTTLSNLWLRCTLRGRFTCLVLELDADGQETILASQECDFAQAQILEMQIEASPRACLVFSRFTFAGLGDFEFLGGYYFTRNEAPEYVNITAIFCTYNREAYLEKNILAIKETQRWNPILHDHFHVIIIDNGSNLDREKYAAYGTYLFHNVNAGGSGGYARGMLEALKLPAQDYALLMDDDVEMEPESLFRMLVFLSFLKKDYCEYFLGGTMFSLKNKSLQRLWRESYDGGDFNINSLNSNVKMCSRKNVLLGANRFEIENQYNGWWMCCIPVAVIKSKGLPLPFFLKWDDMEYSIRNKSRVLQLNGICVWHEDFFMKLSPLNNFLWIKNALVVALLTAPHQSYFNYNLLLFWYDSIKQALKLDYDLLETHVRAIRMVRKGPAHLKSLYTVIYEAKYLRNKSCATINDREVYDSLTDKCIAHTPESSFFKKIIMAITLNGHLLPPFCTKKEKIVEDVYPVQAFYASKIISIDTRARVIHVYHRDRIRFFSLLASYCKEWFLLLISSKRLMRAYREAHPYLSSRKFWKKYLGVDSSKP